VLTNLAEGPRLRFFAIEVDWVAATDGTAVLVPRVAYVPADVAGGPTPEPPADPAVGKLIDLIDQLATRCHVRRYRASTGRRWGNPAVLGVYRTSTGGSVNLPEVSAVAGDEARTELRAGLEAIFPDQRLAPEYPYLQPSVVLDRWVAVEPVVRCFSTR